MPDRNSMVDQFGLKNFDLRIQRHAQILDGKIGYNINTI